MAKNKPQRRQVASKSSLRPAAWWSNLPNADARARQSLYINSTVKLLRQYFTGFDSSDGYDLRHIERLSGAKLNQIKKYGARIHELTASPHYRAVVRSDRDRKVLTQYTGQIYRGKVKPRAFVVHHPEAQYRDIKITVNKAGRVSYTKVYPGMKQRSQIFLFRDYGIDPKTFHSTDVLVKATRKMIRVWEREATKRAAANKKKKGSDVRADEELPGMLPGWYQLENSMHGPIWYAMERDDIIPNLIEFGHRYTRSTEFSKSMIGFRYFKDELSAEVKANALKELRRERARQKERFKHSKAMRQQVARWQALHGWVRGKRKPAKKKKARKSK